MSANRILYRIAEMGADPKVSVAEIDEYVDACINFLKSEFPDTDLSDDIFEIEATRQEALITKYSRTGQP